MPELLEIEMYRRGAATIVGRTISRVETPDDWYLKGVDAKTIRSTLVGATIKNLGRIGKLMLADTTSATIGLRFGMTGIPLVDDAPVIAELEYSSKRLDPSWNRFILGFDGGGSFAMNDPRRLGGVELEPDVDALGPDAWVVTEDELHLLFAKYRVAAKALLLNQKRIAGIGNLLADELLWRASISPQRAANQVSTAAVTRLAQELPLMLAELYERGGSNCGDHFPERSADGRCPRDGTEMSHATVGGRSTWWCASHQV